MALSLPVPSGKATRVEQGGRGRHPFDFDLSVFPEAKPFKNSKERGKKREAAPTEKGEMKRDFQGWTGGLSPPGPAFLPGGRVREEGKRVPVFSLPRLPKEIPEKAQVLQAGPPVGKSTSPWTRSSGGKGDRDTPAKQNKRGSALGGRPLGGPSIFFPSVINS